MDRVILHVDANCFYASVEILYHPELRGKPVAVCGSPEDRHGIVLTKSQEAKRAGVKTGEAIWQARQKCPNLVVVKPHYDQYVRFSGMLRAMLGEYSELVEPYGLDEAWVDVSAPTLSVEGGGKLADEIRRRTREELGITVSVGVSFNKVFAKLGSDMKKPDGTTVITRENFRDTVWNLCVSELLFVGHSTCKRLALLNILTIGDLARADADVLQGKLGKNGLTIKAFALGCDHARVLRADEAPPIKSVGNSVTPARDLETWEDVRCVAYLMAESVGARLRSAGFRADCVSLSVRSRELIWRSCQAKLPRATDLTGEIAKTALALFRAECMGDLPIRSLGIQCTQLVPADQPEQLDFFGEYETRSRAHALDCATDELKRRFGQKAILRGVELLDRNFAKICPLTDHQPLAAPLSMG